jgi:hypothetical protein
MELIQIVLPLYIDGVRLSMDVLRRTLDELTDRFGGATAFTRAPAEGLWEDDTGRVVRDDVIVVEVMVETRDDGWWTDYKKGLEARFKQQTIVVRSLPCRLI